MENCHAAVISNIDAFLSLVNVENIINTSDGINCTQQAFESLIIMFDSFVIGSHCLLVLWWGAGTRGLAGQNG